MKRILLIFISLLLFVMCSCSKDEEMDTILAPNQVQINASIESVNTLTRAQTGIDGKGSFVDNDVISLI